MKTATTALDRSSSNTSMETARHSSNVPKNRITGNWGEVAPVSPTVIYLPFPPSNNNLFANGKSGGRFPSERYRSWKRVADTEFLVQKRNIAKQKGPVNIWIYLEDRDNRIKDADNFSKAAIDYCVAQKIIRGDDKRTVRSVHLIWSPETEGCMVSIWPAPISAEG